MKDLHYSEMDDQALMQLLVAENLTAWSELVRRYGNLVYSIAYQVLNNNSDTEDAVQNTFVRLKIYSAKYDPSMPLKPWLSQIASGEAIRIYQRKKNINKKESSRMEPKDYSIPSPKQDVSEVAAQKEIEVMVKKAIELLPELSRVAITLYFVGGMSQTEIAKELGLSQFSISEKIKYGLEKIKMHLKNAGVQASIVISPILVQESLSKGSLPLELSQKLSKCLPTQDQIANAQVINTKIGFWTLKSKLILASISSILIILGGTFYLTRAKKNASIISSNDIESKKKIIMLATGNANSDTKSIQTISEENKFSELPFEGFIPVGIKYVEFKKDPNMPDIVEGNAEVLGAEMQWKILKNKSGKNIFTRNVISGKDELDGFYFKPEFTKPHIFKGSIKINSDKCKLTFLMSTPMKEEEFHQINAKTSNKMVYSRKTAQVTTLQGYAGNKITFKIYVWIYNHQLFSASFIKCDGYPESMVARTIPVFNQDFKLGVISNGKVELYDVEYCPLDQNWDCRMSSDIQKRIKDIPKNFYDENAIVNIKENPK